MIDPELCPASDTIPSSKPSNHNQNGKERKVRSRLGDKLTAIPMRTNGQQYQPITTSGQSLVHESMRSALLVVSAHAELNGSCISRIDRWYVSLVCNDHACHPIATATGISSGAPRVNSYESEAIVPRWQIAPSRARD